jgi:hypothetical protein
VIDAVAIAKIIATLFGMWALGFSMGKAVAWVRKIADVG